MKYPKLITHLHPDHTRALWPHTILDPVEGGDQAFIVHRIFLRSKEGVQEVADGLGARLGSAEAERGEEDPPDPFLPKPACAANILLIYLSQD